MCHKAQYHAPKTLRAAGGPAIPTRNGESVEGAREAAEALAHGTKSRSGFIAAKGILRVIAVVASVSPCGGGRALDSQTDHALVCPRRAQSNDCSHGWGRSRYAPPRWHRRSVRGNHWLDGSSWVTFCDSAGYPCWRHRLGRMCGLRLSQDGHKRRGWPVRCIHAITPTCTH